MALPSTLANLVPPDEAGLVRRIEALEAQQRENLPALMAAIAPMFADINTALANANTAITAANTAISNLAAQVTRIDALVNQQNVPATSNAAQSGITFSTVATAYSTATFIVPAGYTQASVMAVSAGFWGGSAGTALQMYTRIAGADGSPMTSAIGSAGFANIASSYARAFAVTPGTSFSAQTIALYSGGSAPTGAITTSAVAFFYR